MALTRQGLTFSVCFQGTLLTSFKSWLTSKHSLWNSGVKFQSCSPYQEETSALPNKGQIPWLKGLCRQTAVLMMHWLCAWSRVRMGTWDWRLEEAQPQAAVLNSSSSPQEGTSAQPAQPSLLQATISLDTKLFTLESKCNWLTPKDPVHLNWLVTFHQNKKTNSVILFSSQLASYGTRAACPTTCSWPRHSTNLLLLSLAAKGEGERAQTPPGKFSQSHRLSKPKVCTSRTHAKHIHHFKASSKTSDTTAQDFGKSPLYLPPVKSPQSVQTDWNSTFMEPSNVKPAITDGHHAFDFNVVSSDNAYQLWSRTRKRTNFIIITWDITWVYVIFNKNSSSQWISYKIIQLVHCRFESGNENY